jgi:hypothetical protein
LCTQRSEEHQWRVRSPWSVTRRRRAQWSGYRPHPSELSTPIVNKSSHGGSSKKFQRFQRIRRGANERIEHGPQKISKKVRSPGGSGGDPEAALGALPGRPPAPAPLAVPGAPRARVGGAPSQARRSPIPSRPSSTPKPGRAPAPSQTGSERPAIQETFSILGAVLEPQSRGVLIRDKLESRGCQWGLPAICVGSVEGDHSDEAAFFRHSRDIERSFSA